MFRSRSPAFPPNEPGRVVNSSQRGQDVLDGGRTGRGVVLPNPCLAAVSADPLALAAWLRLVPP